MIRILKTYKCKDIQKSSKEENVFFVLQNPETNLFFSTKYGVAETIEDAGKYKTVGMLKSVINKIYYPKKSIILQILEETGAWEEKKLPKDAFDECLVHKVLISD